MDQSRPHLLSKSQICLHAQSHHGKIQVCLLVYRTDIFPIGCFLDVERISKDLLIRGKFFDSTILVALSLYVSKTSERGPCAR